MELFEAIHTRRSIRKYQDKIIPETTIERILSAAMMAPSAGDARPWQFIIVTTPEQKKRIKAVHPYVGMITSAPLGILICGDLTREKHAGFWPLDCSAAMQNLLLAVHGSGLGAVWTGIYPVEDRVERFKDIFALPNHIVPFGLAVMGSPAQQLSSEERFSMEFIHYDRWQSKERR